MRDHDQCSASSVFWSFILGGIVGAGITLLMAPQSGKEAREKIKEFAEDVKDKTTDYVDQAKDVIKSSVEESKNFIDERKSVLGTAVDAGKAAYEKEKNKLS
jgi:gas vesicle protein